MNKSMYFTVAVVRDGAARSSLGDIFTWKANTSFKYSTWTYIIHPFTPTLILHIVCAVSEKNISEVKSIKRRGGREERGSKVRFHLSTTSLWGRSGRRGDKVKVTLNFTKPCAGALTCEFSSWEVAQVQDNALMELNETSLILEVMLSTVLCTFLLLHKLT